MSLFRNSRCCNIYMSWLYWHGLPGSDEEHMEWHCLPGLLWYLREMAWQPFKIKQAQRVLFEYSWTFWLHFLAAHCNKVFNLAKKHIEVSIAKNPQEFGGGEMSNAELVERLERQFAGSRAQAKEWYKCTEVSFLAGSKFHSFAYIWGLDHCWMSSQHFLQLFLSVPLCFFSSQDWSGLTITLRQLVKSAEVRIRHRQEQQKKAWDLWGCARSSESCQKLLLCWYSTCQLLTATINHICLCTWICPLLCKEKKWAKVPIRKNIFDLNGFHRNSYILIVHWAAGDV